MYTEFYGLSEKPFALVPDPRFLFLGASHHEALAHLLYGIEEGEGFIEVIGQVGTGKTTLCRTLVDRVGPEVDLAYIFNPSFSETELLAAINREFGLPSAGRSPAELVDELNRHLLARKAKGRRALLIIDEAQNIEPRVLEQIRLISNLETEREKLIQIVLIGQPELDELLERTDLRQLRQRITVRWSLEPFSAQETAAYLEHRLKIAGATGASPFSASAVRRIHRASGGVPRLINALADRTLLIGFGAGRRRVEAWDVPRAARELPAANTAPRLRPRSAAVLLAVGILGGLVFAGWSQLSDPYALAHRALEATGAGPDLAGVATVALHRSGLEASLAASTSSGSAASAMDALLEAWGYPALGLEALEPNEYASAVRRVSPLRVFALRALPAQLERFGLPAVLEFEVEPVGLRYAALLEFDAEGIARVETGGSAHELTPAALARLSTGRVFLPWTNFESLPAMSAGMQGSAVRWLQARLTGLGHLPAGAPSGVFDAVTTQAVRAFQAQRGLEATGDVGPETLIALYQALRYGAPALRVRAEGEIS